MTKTAPDILRIAVAQLNPTVGDVAGNLAKAREARADAARQGADLVLYTELFLAGYPPEDHGVEAFLPQGLREGGRGFREGDRRWRTRRHHRHAAEAQKRHA
ncbi:nitrilase-related carbon-nitrogen hydrolase [Mesorhizobium atlanticum]